VPCFYFIPTCINYFLLYVSRVERERERVEHSVGEKAIFEKKSLWNSTTAAPAFLQSSSSSYILLLLFFFAHQRLFTSHISLSLSLILLWLIERENSFRLEWIKVFGREFTQYMEVSLSHKIFNAYLIPMIKIKTRGAEWFVIKTRE
jgi:hypothetical protein